MNTQSISLTYIKNAVVLNMFLLRNNWLVGANDFSEMETLATETYHQDSRFQAYVDTLFCLISSEFRKLESELSALRAELDGADKVISNLKTNKREAHIGFCRHIKTDPFQGAYISRFGKNELVPDDWKYCPVCGNERPFKQ